MPNPAVITGASYGMLVARNEAGTILATAFNGREGWHISLHTTPRGKIFVACEDDARLVLATVAAEIAGAS
jgi:hypothetical protein